MYELRISPKAAKYIKKIKDKNLVCLFKEAFEKICGDPYSAGEMKIGDLAGIFGYDIYYNKTNYEIAYAIEESGDKIVIVVLAGTRENFYNELKRYL